MDESMQELTPRECWQLLSTTDLGRLGVCFDGSPEIFPVNYVLANGTLLFRTSPGLKHVAVRLGQTLAFETDSVDREAGIAWSVIVKGRGYDVTSETELEYAASLPLFPAHGAAKDLFVRIEPDTITGRRFAIVDARHWTDAPPPRRPQAPR